MGTEEKNFMERFEDALHHAKLTRADIARRSTISASTFTRWAQGVSPKLENIRTIAEITGVSMDWLDRGAGPMLSAQASTLRDAPGVGTPYVAQLPQPLSQPLPLPLERTMRPGALLAAVESELRDSIATGRPPDAWLVDAMELLRSQIASPPDGGGGDAND